MADQRQNVLMTVWAWKGVRHDLKKNTSCSALGSSEASAKAKAGILAMPARRTPTANAQAIKKEGGWRMMEALHEPEPTRPFRQGKKRNNRTDIHLYLVLSQMCFFFLNAAWLNEGPKTH